jgi:hypothetical protein
VFPPGKLVVNWVEEEPAAPASHQMAVDRHWERILAERPQANLFDGPLCRLVDWRVSDDTLQVSLGKTRYRELLYSNAHAHELTEAGHLELLSRALGVSAVVRTADCQVILLQRSEKVGEAPGLLDVVGGHIEPLADQRDGVPDPWVSIAGEIGDELHIPESHLKRWCCLGLIETTGTLKPEMIFSVEVTDTFLEVSQRSIKARDHFEFHRLLPIPEEQLQRFLEESIDGTSPSAVGALRLYLERHKPIKRGDAERPLKRRGS